ncbi:MAG: phosphatidate cytidylyltransferase, partial [Tissierellia bacterium]|nr:phosphatidate cytidylyltransferase [Tissierellia bacterium]
MKGVLTRTISGFIIVLLTIFITARGGTLISYFTFLLSIIGIREFYNAMKGTKVEPIKIIGYISCIGFLFNSLGYSWVSLMSIVFFSIISLLIVLIFKNGTTLTDIAITFLGIFYIPFLIQHIIYLEGTIYIWLVFITAWGTDTFAYISGNLFGKTKLCPKLSPNKTVEGSVGGILGTALLTLIFAKYFELFPLWNFVLLSFLGSIVAQLGDLTASKIKRITGIKDFGFIMPGHGGIL